MNFSRVSKDVLSTIKPTIKQERSEKALANALMKTLRPFVPKGARVVLTGSIAKNTFLADSKDIDLFILLPKTIGKGQFEQLLKKIIARAFPSARYEMKYAEHPYARIYLEQSRVDIVPAYEMKRGDRVTSAVDRSVLHTAFILKKLKKKQQDDVLLLKKLLRANGIYGAEIKIEGFSGYLCELLIIKCGDFARVMKSVAGWKPPVFVDIEKYYEKEDVPAMLKRFNTPLVVIDPVDKERNVAAAVSMDNVKRIMGIAKKVLRTPSAKLFLAEPPGFDDKVAMLKKRAGKKGAVFIMSMERPDAVDDIVWGQLRRLGSNIVSYFECNDFKVNARILGDDENAVSIAILVKERILPDKKIMNGPQLKFEKNVVEFKKAHKKQKVFVKKGRLFVIVDRKIKTADDAIKLFFKTAIIPSRFEDKKPKIVRIWPT